MLVQTCSIIFFFTISRKVLWYMEAYKLFLHTMTSVSLKMKSPSQVVVLCRRLQNTASSCSLAHFERIILLSLSFAHPSTSVAFKKWSFSEPNSDWHKQCYRSLTMTVFPFSSHWLMITLQSLINYTERISFFPYGFLMNIFKGWLFRYKSLFLN